jgi:hypothetical protein
MTYCTAARVANSPKRPNWGPYSRRSSRLPATATTTPMAAIPDVAISERRRAKRASSFGSSALVRRAASGNPMLPPANRITRTGPMRLNAARNPP